MSATNADSVADNISLFSSLSPLLSLSCNSTSRDSLIANEDLALAAAAKATCRRVSLRCHSISLKFKTNVNIIEINMWMYII